MPPPQQLLSSSVSFKCLNFYLKVYPVFFILILALLPLSAPSIPNSYTHFNSTKICIEGEPWPDGNFCFALKNSSLLKESAQQELTKRQGMAVEMFCDMVRILTKIDCSQPYSVHVHHNQCGQCQDAYRDWVCSVVVESIKDTFGDVINHHSHQSPMPFRSCDSICNHVLRVCPYLSPDRVQQIGPSGNASLHPSQYGGHPAFYCPTRLSPFQLLSQRLEERAAAYNHPHDHHHSSSTSSTLLPSFHHDNNNNNNNYFNKHTNNNHNNNPNNNNNNLNNGMSIQYSYTFRRGNEVNLTDEFFTSNDTACCWTYSRALRSERVSGDGQLPHHDDDYDDTFPLSLLDDPKNYVQIQCVQAAITYATPPTTTQDNPEDLEAEEDEGGGGRLGGDDSAYNPTNAQPHHNTFDDRTLSKFIIDFDTEPGVSDVYDYVELANGATSSAGRSAVASSDVSRSDSISESASGGDIKSSSSSSNNNANNDPSSQSPSEKELSDVGHAHHGGHEDIEILDVETPEVAQLDSHSAGGIDGRRSGAERPAKSSSSASSDHHHHHHERIGPDHPPQVSGGGSSAQSGNYYLGQDWFHEAEGSSSSDLSASSGSLKTNIKSIQKRNNYLAKTFPGNTNLRRPNLPTTKSQSRSQLSPRSRQEHLQLPQLSPRESLLSSAGTSGETLDTVGEEDIDVEDLLYTGTILDEDDNSVKLSHHHHHHHRDSGKEERSSTVKTSADERRGVKSESAHLDHTYLHQRRLLQKRPSDYMDDEDFDGTSSAPRSERSTPSGNRDSQEFGPSWITSIRRSTTSIPFAKSSAGRLTPTFSFPGSLTWGGSGMRVGLEKRDADPELSLLPPLVLITCLVYSMILIFSCLIRKLDLLLNKFSTNNFLPKVLLQVQRLVFKPSPILSTSLISKSILSSLPTNKCVPGGRRSKHSPPSIIFFSKLPIPRLTWIGGRASHGDDDGDEERRWDKIRRGKRQMTISSHASSTIFTSLPSTPTTTPSCTHPLYFSSSLHRHKSDKWLPGGGTGFKALNKSKHYTSYQSPSSQHGVKCSPRKITCACPSCVMIFLTTIILYKSTLRHSKTYFHHHPSILSNPAQQILYRLPTIANHNSLSPFNPSASSTNSLATTPSHSRPLPQLTPSKVFLHSEVVLLLQSDLGLSLLSLQRISYYYYYYYYFYYYYSPSQSISCFYRVRSDFLTSLLLLLLSRSKGQHFPHLKSVSLDISYALSTKIPLLVNSLTGLGYDTRVTTNFQNKLQKSVPVQLPRILWMTNNTIIILINIFKFNTICLMMGWRSDVLLVGLGHSLGALVYSATNSPIPTPGVSQPPPPAQQQRRRREICSLPLCNLNSYYYYNCYKFKLRQEPLHTLQSSDLINNSPPPLPPSLFRLTAPSASLIKLFQMRYYRHLIPSFPNHLTLLVTTLAEESIFDFLVLTTLSFVLNSTHVTAKLAVMRLTATLHPLLLLLLLTCLTARLVVGHLVLHPRRPTWASPFPEHLKNHHPRSLSLSMPSWRAPTLDMSSRNCHPYISGSSACYCPCWKRYYKTIRAVW